MALWKSPPRDHRHLYAVLWVLQTVTRSSCQRWAEEKGHLHSVENIPFLLSILGPWILLNFSEAGSLGDGLEILLELVLQMMSLKRPFVKVCASVHRRMGIGLLRSSLPQKDRNWWVRFLKVSLRGRGFVVCAFLIRFCFFLFRFSLRRPFYGSYKLKGSANTISPRAAILSRPFSFVLFVTCLPHCFEVRKNLGFLSLLYQGNWFWLWCEPDKWGLKSTWLPVYQTHHNRQAGVFLWTLKAMLA